MLFGMTEAVVGAENTKDYTLYISQFFRVVLAKFVCSVALHFMLYPHLDRSLKVMKYVINHPDKFTNFIMPCLCCSLCVFITMWAEIVNVYLLCY